MFTIVKKQTLAPGFFLFEIKAPLVAAHAQPGQFVMLRIDQKGERIPITIYDFDRKEGNMSIVFQDVGKTTKQLGLLEEGDSIQDVLGPLGHPTIIPKDKTVVCIAGGSGIAMIFPLVRALKESNCSVISIIGAKKKELLILEDKIGQYSDELIVTTDDGSYGLRGFVTDALKEVITKHERIDEVFSVGPIPMMKATVDITKPKNIKTTVSLNANMVDATGMCGTCRVTVGGKTLFTCCDGPDFDGFLVDFDELKQRQERFLEQEKISLEKFQKEFKCKKGKKS